MPRSRSRFLERGVSLVAMSSSDSAMCWWLLGRPERM
jgi:cyclic lactone autoinducer peptide